MDSNVKEMSNKQKAKFTRVKGRKVAGPHGHGGAHASRKAYKRERFDVRQYG